MKKVSPSSGTLESTNTEAQKLETLSLVMKLEDVHMVFIKNSC